MATTAVESTGAIFINGRILQRTEPGLDGQATFASAMYIDDGKVAAVGTADEITSAYGSTTTTHDLGGRMVLPGFVDGHMHLLMLGQSLQKLGLEHCRTLDDILVAIRSYASANPHLKRILCKGWMHSMTDGKADAAMLRGLDGERGRPIFIDSKDLHSTWCNDAALEELGVTDMPDPPGGRIHRGQDGRPSGLLDEAAVLTIVWPHQANRATVEERIESIKGAIAEYQAAGYTGMVEMAMDEGAWEALRKLYFEEPDTAMRIAAYWLVKPSAEEQERLTQVDRAIELSAQFNAATSPNLRVVGIKIICDGIVDACTAFLSEPYATANSPPPFWTKPQLEPVVRKAAAASLQVALHAIGDGAITMAVDVLEAHCSSSTNTNDNDPGHEDDSGSRRGRHRIEHLELASAADAQRIGSLGITASIQPVHADPAILGAWPRLLGPHRCGRAFPYRDLADAGAPLAIGSDSPTAPWRPAGNLHVACTRRSAREPPPGEMVGPDAVNEHFRLGLGEAVAAATEGAARSVLSTAGRLVPGRSADFVVMDMEWGVESLLKAQVEETWFGGRQVWKASH